MPKVARIKNENGETIFRVIEPSGAEIRGRVSLNDLLSEGRTVKLEDGEYTIKPLTLGGAAELERMQAKGEIVDGDASSRNMLALLAILINQDRPVGKRLTLEEVGALVTTDRLEEINAVVEEMTRPLQEAATRAANKMTSQTIPG